MATQAVLEDAVESSAPSGIALVEATERGLPLEEVAELRSCGLTFAEVGEIVVPPRTLKHRQARGQRLTAEESERLLRVRKILALADRIFGDHDKALHWLRMPDPRWNDRSGLSLLKTESGAKFVENVLWQIDEGMFP
jgi:putative toxin-antitoxin system antitoxin component (TIGR02293 family)